MVQPVDTTKTLPKEMVCDPQRVGHQDRTIAHKEAE